MNPVIWQRAESALVAALTVVATVPLGFAWAFHVAVDRALGYGLKHDDAFTHTHLGWLPSSRHDRAVPAPRD